MSSTQTNSRREPTAPVIFMQPAESQDGPFSLDEIKMALVFKAYEQRFFQPLKIFFNRMVLKWGKAQTAYATRIDDVPTIVLGRKFFAKKVESVAEAAEVLMHEIMHHLFAHLVVEIRGKGYSHKIMNIAADAIINAYLASKGMATFMRRFYSDSGYYAFLRPGSVNVRVEPERLGFKVDDEGQIFYRNLQSLNVTLEEAAAFFHKYFNEVEEGPQPFLGSHESKGTGESQDDTSEEESEGSPQSGPDEDNDQAPSQGGQSEDALDAEPDEDNDQAPSQRGQSEDALDAEPDEDNDQATSQGGQSEDSSEAERDQERNSEQSDNQAEDIFAESTPGGIFNGAEAKGILRDLKVGKASQVAKNNFEQVINTISVSSDLPGSIRDGSRLSRRIPAKLGHRDLLRIERGRYLFTRWNYHRRKFAIILDVSGSVKEIIPFITGLVKSLRCSENEVRSFVWATGIAEVDPQELGTKEVNVGWGNEIERVAECLEENDDITDVVIITDNYAGDLTTRINCNVHLCLLPKSKLAGSFIDPLMVPQCTIHELQLGI